MNYIKMKRKNIPWSIKLTSPFREKKKLIQAEQDLLQKEFELYEAKIKLEKFIKPLKL